ncbi:MAG: hypothetical protein HY825_16010 [Acidobacteria bacterium]|nr:hypothetical protein [Acidobacteriota bacterium]
MGGSEQREQRRCNYCGTDHPTDELSDEHIIPEYMFNASYVLPDVCIRANNYMAVAFETPVRLSPTMREILLLYSPKPAKGPIYRGKVQTERGTTEDLWLKDGEEYFSSLPAYVETDEVRVTVQTADGDSAQTTIKLPFKVAARAEGAAEFVGASAERRLQADKKKLESYLASIREDPERNPAFAAFLRASDARPRREPVVEMTVTRQSTTSESVVSDALPRVTEVDGDLYAKQIMKIAWTHACRQLGREVLGNPVGDAILGFIAGGHIPEDVVVAVSGEVGAGQVDSLLRDSTVAGERFYWWRDSPEIAAAKAMALGNGSATQELQRFAGGRLQAAKECRQFIKWSKVIEIGPERGDQLAGRRFHALTIEDDGGRGRTATVVRVVLFGGIIDAKVQVADRVVPHAQVLEKRIDF